MTDTSGTKELLYVSYFSPPLLGAGVVRTQQFCRILPRLNWRPTLLTTTITGSEAADEEFARQGVEVLRARGGVNEDRVRANLVAAGFSATSLRTWLLRWAARWLLLPDRQVLWRRPAIRYAMAEAPQHRWKCVFGTLHPISGAWAACTIAKALNLPFVLEYRDIITDKYKGGPPTPLHRKRIHAIERSLVLYASRIVTVSPGIKDWIVERHGVPADFVEMIPTGYLDEDKQHFDQLPQPRNDRFTLTYAGMFYRDRKPDVLLQAVRRLIDSGAVPRDKIRVELISNLPPSAARQFDLEGVLETSPLVAREEVFQRYAASDVLLLICDKRQYQNVTIPGKLFEYLMCEKPILGLLGKESVSADVLRNSGLAVLADADDVTEAAGAIENLYVQWRGGGFALTPNRPEIERFSCNNLTKRLADILDEVSA